MHNTFTRADFTVADNGALIADASDCGFGVGAPMPLKLTIDGHNYWYRHTHHDAEGDVTKWDYSDGWDQQHVVLFND